MDGNNNEVLYATVNKTKVEEKPTVSPSSSQENTDKQVGQEKIFDSRQLFFLHILMISSLKETKPSNRNVSLNVLLIIPLPIPPDPHY